MVNPDHSIRDVLAKGDEPETARPARLRIGEDTRVQDRTELAEVTLKLLRGGVS